MVYHNFDQRSLWKYGLWILSVHCQVSVSDIVLIMFAVYSGTAYRYDKEDHYQKSIEIELSRLPAPPQTYPLCGCGSLLWCALTSLTNMTNCLLLLN